MLSSFLCPSRVYISAVINHQEARLRLIDFYLTFIGFASRKNLIEHFGVATATASRDFKLYEQTYTEQIVYSVRRRRYERLGTFSPVFDHDIQSALQFLTSDKWVVPHTNPGLGPGISAFVPDGLDLHKVALISRAIASQTIIYVDYAAASSGFSTRYMAPHSLLTNGLAWYVRAFDRKSTEFRNFRLSRFLRVEPIDEACASHERSDEDNEWVTTVTLTLAPHPKQTNQEAFRRDLGLTDKPVVNLEVPSAMAGFTLSAMRVDCSPNGSMEVHQFPLRCMNLHELDHVDSMRIAPGVYSEVG